jgi:hypothetical protein
MVIGADGTGCGTGPAGATAAVPTASVGGLIVCVSFIVDVGVWQRFATKWAIAFTNSSQ